jgi:MoaA/NifB/PqqE/SkfB family radical SAM enzyme
MMKFENLKIIDSDRYKICKSSDYYFIFNKETGFFARWGKTKAEDPIYAPGPEILDLEISTGKCSGRCDFCYKGNGEDRDTYHMTLEDFKTIFNKVNKIKTLTQIAFGICDIKSNKDFFKMMKYCREKGVIPNYTCNGFQVTSEVAKRTAELCGAVAVSIVDKEKTYDAIKKFTDAKLNKKILIRRRKKKD